MGGLTSTGAASESVKLRWSHALYGIEGRVGSPVDTFGFAQ